MFELHETTRRRLCRAVFCAACLLPTAGVATWGLARRLPGQVAAHAGQLRAELGFGVALESVEHPRPGTVLYRGLELSDPETGQRVAACQVLEVVQTGGSVAATASLVELDAERAPLVWSLIERILRAQTPERVERASFTADPVTWHTPAGSQTFNDVLVDVGRDETSDAVEIALRLAGSETAEAATLRVARNRSGPPTTAVSLHTGSTPLPCTLFTPLVDLSQWLGNAATFHGYLWLSERPTGWEGEVTGELAGLDLDALVSDHFPHVLRGTGEVRLERARLAGDRLVAAAGTFTAGPGEIGQSLVAAAAAKLGFESDAQIGQAQIMPYEALAFDFTLDEKGFTLHGRADKQAALLVANHRAVWFQPTVEPQPAVALVRTLVPASGIEVPATKESDILLRHLPLPSAMPTHGATQGAPRAHVRVGR